MLVDRWHPVTCDMGLIQMQPKDAASALVDWHRSIGTTYTQQTATSFGQALEALPPLSMEKRRRLFVPTRSGWTACFQSGIKGSDPPPAMSHLARTVGVLAMRVCAMPPEAVWPAVAWEVYGPESLGGEPPLGYVRSIAALNDGGRWDFHESGTRYAFERPEYYELRRKRDRFTRELLTEYLAQFGLAPFDDGFYTVSAASPAILLEDTRHWSRPAPEFTLQEVLDGRPWRRTSAGEQARPADGLEVVG